MSGIEWIAAVLNPADVAPHPNFTHSEQLSPHGLLALVVGMRWSDYERIITGEELSDGQQPQLEVVKAMPEMPIVIAARQSLDAESQRQGIDALAGLCADQQLSAGARVAACLLANVGLAEMDEFDQLLQVLTTCLHSLPDPDTSDMLLIRAVLLQQRAMRSAEAGLDGREFAEQCLDNLDVLRPSEFSRFPTSRGVSWTSSRTLSQVSEQLHATADAFIANAQPERFLSSNEWVRFVRNPPPLLSLRVERNAATASWAYVKELFRQRVGSTTRTFFSQDPVEPGVSAVLLHAELVGDLPACRHWRSRVGMTRVLRTGADAGWYFREALRLFRQAEDLASLDLTLRVVRSGGPLEAVASDARQVVEQRLAPERQRMCEHAVLAAAAPFMDAQLASRALDGVLEALKGGLLAPSRGWHLYSVRAERAWLAAVALAATAQRLDVMSEALRAAVDAAAESSADDELLRRAFVKAVGSIDWSGVSSDVRVGWAEWLSRENHVIASELREAMGPDLGLEPTREFEAELRFVDIPSFLNRTIVSGYAPNPAQVSQAARLAVDALSAKRVEAAGGRFSVGGPSPSEVAAGLCLYWGADIWTALADFLRDPAVDPSDKAPALSRLAFADSEPPESFVRDVGANLDELVRATSVDIFQQPRRRNTEAIRFAIRHGLFSEQATVVEVATLAASTATDDRVEAARCLGLLAELDAASDWVIVLAFQLSMDPGPLVRAEAGRTLGVLSTLTRGYARLVEDRVSELLSEDGLVVPLLVLRGLGTGRGGLPLSASLTRRIRTMAASHVAVGVRLQASSVLEQADS